MGEERSGDYVTVPFQTLVRIGMASAICGFIAGILITLLILGGP